MKGANPFTLWGTEPRDFIGRKSEINIYESFLKEIGASQPDALLVAGAPGSGRSTLLRKLSRESEKAGVFAPVVRVGDSERFQSFISKLASELLAYAEEKSGEGMLSERMLSGVKSAMGGEDMLLAFARMAGKHAQGMVILIDDADLLGKPEELSAFATRMMKAALAEQLKFGFVLSYVEGFAGFEGIGRKIKLKPFEEHETREMVEVALKKGQLRMGEECLRTIIDESGGNLLVVKTICWAIYDRLPDNEKIMTQRHYLTHYPAVMSTLSREFFDGLYLNLPTSEREVLRAFAAAGKPAYISDIARTLGKRHATTLALRLVEKGQLTRVDRGLYKVFTRLYGRYALQRA